MTETAPQRRYAVREVFNGLRWLVRAGAPWRLLPNALPPWAAVYQQTQRWLRAGTEMKYHWGNEIGVNRASCARCGSQWDGRSTAPVGSFDPNAWGLHDMHGNASEWVQDCWNESYVGAPNGGSAWESGNCRRRVERGGSWVYILWNTGSSGRLYEGAPNRYRTNLGFRIARTLP